MKIEAEIFTKQGDALDRLTDDFTNEVLYGGGARGGKSWLGNLWVITETFAKPGSYWLIGRQQLGKLKDTTMLTFFEILKLYSITNKFYFNAQTNIAINIDTNARIFFREIRYLPSDPEYDRLGSYDLTGAFIDEAQEIHPKAISVLRGRFSRLSGEGWKTIPKALYTCNPKKNWIYNEFYKPFKENTLSHDRAFIRALVPDNPTVSQDYIDNLKKSDKVTRERLLYGNFEYDDDDDRLMSYDSIIDIFNNEHVVENGTQKYITADVARKGSDRAVIAVWYGFVVVELQVYPYSLITTLQEAIKGLQKKYKIPNSRVLADEDGVGGGLVDNLGIKGFLNGGKVINGENYANLKTQCMYKFAERVGRAEVWIKADIGIETHKLIIEELEQVKQSQKDTEGKLKVVPKEEIKRNLGRSPDFMDTLIMREYFELHKEGNGMSAYQLSQII